MKRLTVDILFVLMMIFFLVLGSRAQVSTFSCNNNNGNALTAINQYCPNSAGVSLTPSGVDTHNVYIIPEGTPGTITVIIQGSVKGDFTDAVTCGTSSTTSANLLSCSGIYTRVRAKLTVFTGFTSVNLTYLGTSSVAKIHDSNSPNGPAGGDLDATYPDPTVVKVNGAAVPASAAFVGTNSSKQIVANTKIQTVRTPYTITAPDIAAGYANIAVTFPVAFADTNYTIAEAITQSTPLDTLNDYSPGDNHLIAVDGFTAQIYVNSGISSPGDVIELDVIAIHD